MITRTALATFCLMATPALADLHVTGFQYRLIWPDTGALSPDVYAQQAGEDTPHIFCGEVAFDNGESWEDFGAPFQGLLLVGVTATGVERSETGTFTLHDPQADPIAIHVAGRAGEITWYPVTILPLWGGMHHLSGTLEGLAYPMPSIASGCAE